MNIHEGKTGRAIREERNHEINAGKPYRRPKFHRLRKSANPLARRNQIWQRRHGVVK